MARLINMTDRLILGRWGNHPQHGSPGELFYMGEKIADTIEQPWNNNVPFHSCVPCGTYEIVPFTRRNGDHVYALVNPDLNVYLNKEDRPDKSGRYEILIHVANWASELQGCIAPGSGLSVNHKYKEVDEYLMVTRSTPTVEKLFNLIKYKNIKYLTIIAQDMVSKWKI